MKTSFAGRNVSFGFDTCQRVGVGHQRHKPQEEMHSCAGSLVLNTHVESISPFC